VPIPHFIEPGFNYRFTLCIEKSDTFIGVNKRGEFSLMIEVIDPFESAGYDFFAFKVDETYLPISFYLNHIKILGIDSRINGI
jgi:hypothetical protein